MKLLEVYWNRTRRLWSVRFRGKVISYETSLTLSGCRFVVRSGTRDKVRKSGKREVHAWISGEESQESWEGGKEVRYNPFRDETFVSEGFPVLEASRVRVTPDGKVFIGG